jgi:hypothetical protein
MPAPGLATIAVPLLPPLLSIAGGHTPPRTRRAWPRAASGAMPGDLRTESQPLAMGLSRWQPGVTCL